MVSRIMEENEFHLLCDAINGVLLRRPGYLALEAEQAIQLYNLDAKWGVDADDLIPRLRQLPEASLSEILRGIEMFWGKEPGYLLLDFDPS